MQKRRREKVEIQIKKRKMWRIKIKRWKENTKSKKMMWSNQIIKKGVTRGSEKCVE